MQQRVRIQDIADELNMSTATVSNVIHGKTKKISDETVRVVQQKLEECGYLPGVAAQLLGQNDLRIVGVVVKNHEKYEGRVLQDPFVSSALNFLYDEIEKSGHFMLLKKATDIMDLVRFASMWNMVGMIVLSFCADEYAELRQRIRIPFVVYDGFFENAGRMCNVSIDDFGGGVLAGKHLRSLGHKNALCIADNTICMDKARCDGFAKGFGRQADFLLVPMQKDERLTLYRERLGWICGHSAVFAVSDYYAAELLQFFAEHGIRVPGDISVMGFDGSALSKTTVPTLTSVAQDVAGRAKVAVSLLMRMKDDKNFWQDVTLPVHLAMGQSTDRPRKKTR